MNALYDLVLFALFALSPAVFAMLSFKPAPYGRHVRGGWGPSLHARWGWLWMELPSVLGITFFFATGLYTRNAVAIVFVALWLSHYVYRTFIFSFRIRSERRMPLAVILNGALFNVANSFVNGYYLNTLAPEPSTSWLTDPRFMIGVVLFFAGMAIHISSDAALLRLRSGGNGGYSIPFGGLFEFVSCPNFFGETLQWAGWAILTWSLPGLAFACFTAANLIPRALAHHRGYLKQFSEYPQTRRAVIPFVL